jgi:hypothetical protein
MTEYWPLFLAIAAEGGVAAIIIVCLKSAGL